MAKFANEQVLNILGVVIAIFLPSAAVLYIRLAEIQRERSLDLSIYKDMIRWNCKSLVVIFLVTLGLPFLKGIFSANKHLASAVNGLSFVALLANLLVLIDLTIAMFDVAEVSSKPTQREGRDLADNQGE